MNKINIKSVILLLKIRRGIYDIISLKKIGERFYIMNALNLYADI